MRAVADLIDASGTPGPRARHPAAPRRNVESDEILLVKTSRTTTPMTIRDRTGRPGHWPVDCLLSRQCSDSQFCISSADTWRITSAKAAWTSGEVRNSSLTDRRTGGGSETTDSGPGYIRDGPVTQASLLPLAPSP